MSFLGIEASLTGRRWVGPGVEVERASELLVQRTGLPQAVCQVLARRGVAPDEAKAFLAPAVRDLLPDQADTLLRGRVAVVNVWRPTRGPVEATPLAVCDAQTMRDGDLVEMDLIYPDRMGEIQALQFRPERTET